MLFPKSTLLQSSIDELIQVAQARPRSRARRWLTLCKLGILKSVDDCLKFDLERSKHLLIANVHVVVTTIQRHVWPYTSATEVKVEEEANVWTRA